MRSLLSFLATKMIAPSSIFLRPIFQASATRIENCSISSGCVVGTIKTAIWLPFRVSQAFNFRVSASISPLESVPVWSTTRPVSGGTGTCARAETWANVTNAQHNNSATKEALTAFIVRDRLVLFGRCRRRRRIEIDLRRGRDFLLVLDGEVGLLLVAEPHRGQIVREGTDADVIILHRLDVAVARHGNAVLGAFELRHQIVKQRVRFELRIIFRDNKQFRQRAGKLALGCLE